MNDRDQFAAAALAGLLGRPDIDDEPLEYHFLCEAAYRWADAMILEQERVAETPVPYAKSDEKRCFFNTKHDAAPAARAQLPEGVHASVGGGSDRTDKAVTRPAVGAGDIVTRLRQTRANMIGTDDEDHYFDCHEAAGEIERLRLWGRLTDEERAAVAVAIAECESMPVTRSRVAADTLRSVLERLK